jgi:hypothetical protein
MGGSLADHPQSNPPGRRGSGRKSRVDLLNEDPTLGEIIEPIWTRLQRKEITLDGVALALRDTGHHLFRDFKSGQGASDWMRDYGAWRKPAPPRTSGVPATPRANGSWRRPTRTAAGCCWVCGADLKTPPEVDTRGWQRTRSVAFPVAEPRYCRRCWAHPDSIVACEFDQRWQNHLACPMMPEQLVGEWWQWVAHEYGSGYAATEHEHRRPSECADGRPQNAENSLEKR